MPEYCAKRDNWFTYNSKLYDKQGNKICFVKFPNSKRPGVLVVGDNCERLKQDVDCSGKWTLGSPRYFIICRGEETEINGLKACVLRLYYEPQMELCAAILVRNAKNTRKLTYLSSQKNIHIIQI